MSRRSLKPAGPANLPAPSSKPRLHPGLLAAIVITLLAGGIPFGLGRYIEVHSPDPFDSSAYVYSAKHLLEGARLGVDEVSSAYPGTLIVNLIGVKLFGFNDVGPKIIQTIMQIAAMIFMFYSIRRFFGSVAAAVCTVTAAVYLSAPLISKGGNVKEQYMIVFMIFAVNSFLHYELTGKRAWLILCGLFAIEPYYFKPTGLSIILAIVVYLLISRSLGRAWKRLWLEYVLFLAGSAAGLLFPGLLYIWQGQLKNLFRTLPAMAIQLGFGVLLAAAVCYYAAAYFAKRQFSIRSLRVVPSRMYKIAAVLLMAGLAAGVVLVAAANLYYRHQFQPAGSVWADIADYLKVIPIFSIPLYLFSEFTDFLHRLLVASGLRGGYVGYSWKLITLSELAPKILRYYQALSVPILMASLSLLTLLFVSLKTVLRKQPLDAHTRVAWLLAGWWIVDMLFTWGSPHSYEQYYLPLCASGATLACYAAWQWQQKFSAASFKMPWLVMGVVLVMALSSLSIPIFIGQRYSPDTGADYTANGGARRRGFGPALDALKARQKYPWEQAGQLIRSRSGPEDKIFVWGWFPGIYIEAQRMAPVPKAYEADMHFMPPELLNIEVYNLMMGFGKQPPKFIVDSRKLHFPFNRPPLELWPIVPPKMLGNDRPRLLDAANPKEIEAFDNAYKQFLRAQIAPDEADRYEVMKPLRDYVMQNYRFAGQFGEHMVFERKQ